MSELVTNDDRHWCNDPGRPRLGEAINGDGAALIVTSVRMSWDKQTLLIAFLFCIIRSERVQITTDNELISCHTIIEFKGSLQKLLSRFFPLRGYPPSPPTPLTENHFAKKLLAEDRKFSLKNWSKRAKIGVFFGQKYLLFTGGFLGGIPRSPP